MSAEEKGTILWFDPFHDSFIRFVDLDITVYSSPWCSRDWPSKTVRARQDLDFEAGAPDVSDSHFDVYP